MILLEAVQQCQLRSTTMEELVSLFFFASCRLGCCEIDSILLDGCRSCYTQGAGVGCVLVLNDTYWWLSTAGTEEDENGTEYFCTLCGAEFLLGL